MKENKLFKIILIIFFSLLALLIVENKSSASDDTYNLKFDDVLIDYSKINVILNKMNEFRQEEGLSNLVLDSNLTRIAEERMRENAIYYNANNTERITGEALDTYFSSKGINKKNETYYSIWHNAFNEEYYVESHKKDFTGDNGSVTRVGIALMYNSGYYIREFIFATGNANTYVCPTEDKTISYEVNNILKKYVNISFVSRSTSTTVDVFNGDKVQLDLKLKSSIYTTPCNLSRDCYNQFKWSTTNENMMTIQSDGLIIFNNVEGTVYLLVRTFNQKTEKDLEIKYNVIIKKPITSLTLSDNYLEIYKGKTVRINSIITPDNTTDSKRMSWSSSDNEIASVSETWGDVRGKKAGTVTITATTSNGLTATCTVVVKEVPVEKIEIPEIIYFKESDFEDLKDFSYRQNPKNQIPVKLYPENTTDKNLEYEILSQEFYDENKKEWVAYIDKYYNAVYPHNPGIMRVKAISTANPNVYTEFKICVLEETPIAINSIYLNKTSLIMEEESQYQLTASINPSTTNYDKTLKWTSDNENVVTVDNNGLLTAKAEGEAIITATTVNGKTSTCSIKVNKKTVPITSVTLNKTETTVNVGDKFTLVPTINPSNTTYSKVITWSTSNRYVVSINSTTGETVAVKSGTATITATTSNGKRTTCIVTVKENSPVTVPITEITLNSKEITLEINKTYNLIATIKPTNTTQSKNVTWTTNNSSIATVDSTGKVTARKSGTATITATTSNGKRATCIVTVKENSPVTVPITEITLNSKEITLEINKTYNLIATIKPTNTTQSKNVTWTTNNSSIATVDNTGKVTAKKSGTAIITATTSNGKKTTCTVIVKTQNKNTNIKTTPNVSYRTHVQNVGWQNYVKNGVMSGTSGRSLRLEGINVKLENQPYSGNIEYCTHVQNIGWQNYVANGTMSGTSGRSLRLEAIKIRLTGEISKYYDVCYRVHAQNIGWMNWAKNGESAGSAGYAYRLEGIEIVIVEKGKNPPARTNIKYNKPFKCHTIAYRTHVQDIGWQGYVYDGEMSGTQNKAKRLEGINIKLENQAYIGSIEYCTHVQNIGWQNYVTNGTMSGTSGRGLRLEAIKIRLTGEMAKHYDIYYRVHSQDVGWMGWAKNGEESGTAGYGRRLEGINIVLVEKGKAAPGSTKDHFIKK